ncbi:MAG: TMEM175 family protein [Rhodanobacter sp.]
MDSGAPLHVKGHHVHQRHFDRLVMLSDGVFAIAMTLSAVELKPESLPGKSLAQIWAIPLLIYFVSFFIIGSVWVRHRRSLAHLRHTDTVLTVLNMALLSLVALTPVMIRLFLTGEGGTASGMLIYALVMMGNYLCLATAWGYAAFVADLAPDVLRPRAWCWLLEELFVVVLFGAMALFSLQLKLLAVLLMVVGVTLRFWSVRLEKAAKQLE